MPTIVDALKAKYPDATGNTIDELIRNSGSGGSADPGYVVSTGKIYYAEEQTVILDENGHASLDIGENTFSDLNPENGKTGYIAINGVEYAGVMGYYGGWYIGSFNAVLDIDGVTASINTVGEANYSQPSLSIDADTSLAGKSITVSVYAIDEIITISEDFTKVVEKLTAIYTYYFDLNTGSSDVTISAGSSGNVWCAISTGLIYNYDFLFLTAVNLTQLSTDLQLINIDYSGNFEMTFLNKSSSDITIPAYTVVGNVLCVRHGHPVVE